MDGPATCPSFEIERRCREAGSRIIAGVDEAGRGALAGPLCVAAVVFPEDIILNPPPELSSIRDSKKLSPRRREAALDTVAAYSLSYTHVFINPAAVDALNVNQATLHALECAAAELCVIPDCILLDGNFSFITDLPVRSIVGGDTLSLSIAAASIVAKVNRDRYMVSFSRRYPHFGFEHNMGYGTAFHRDAIRKYGPCPEHRRTYEPVRSLYADTESY
ncbi:MAG: ribonuclease HII [Spirochaetota bacterium]